MQKDADLVRQQRLDARSAAKVVQRGASGADFVSKRADIDSFRASSGVFEQMSKRMSMRESYLDQMSKTTANGKILPNHSKSIKKKGIQDDGVKEAEAFDKIEKDVLEFMLELKEHQ